MEQWQSSLWVAAIAAIAGLVGAAIGRERWPADLRDARRLGEIVDKMETGTKEREFAAMYRDDLASRCGSSGKPSPGRISVGISRSA